MTSVKALLYQRIVSDSAVGQIAGRNVFPQQAREDSSFPMVVFYQLPSQPLQALEAQLGTERHTYQVDCMALTYQRADELSVAVKNALKSWSDETVSSCRLDDQHDDLDEPRTSSENAVHRVIQVWIIWAKQ